ncbi:MAG: zf-HC2 domain-containing protein [candidate division NC10 bacterium]|nr:zf-HC2 domain-containing protein [candidate division NC10 bacterium]
MRSCKELIDLMADYLEGQLDPDVARDLDQHLADCLPCLSFLKTYRATTRLIREVACEEIPPELGERLERFLRERLGKTPTQ